MINRYLFTVGFMPVFLYYRYSYDTPIVLVPEIDGLRIIGHFQHEILQRVPGNQIELCLYDNAHHESSFILPFYLIDHVAHLAY